MNIILCLFRIKLLRPLGLIRILKALFFDGSTLNTLLSYCSLMYGDKIALSQDNEKISYNNLYYKANNLAVYLSNEQNIKEGDKVAIISKNSIMFCISLCSLTRTGAHVFLLNPEISKAQFEKLNIKHQFAIVIFENKELKEKLSPSLPNYLILEGKGANSLSNWVENRTSRERIKKIKSGNIIVLTGGTTGDFKTASRKQNIFDFLYPLSALVNTLKLHKFKSVYIPIPISHGFGLSALIVSLILGSEIHLTNVFDAKHGANLINKYRIEVLVLVPTILRRMLTSSPSMLKNVQRIISGGAPLDAGLISETLHKIGSVLSNLYGTTEAGFCVLGTSDDLKQNPYALGRAIKGVNIRLSKPRTISELEVKSRWSYKKDSWVKTGDLALIDESNLIYLKGRTDSMIVSGGENVYPSDLEVVLSQHPQIESVSVIGVSDKIFGSRLKAFVVLMKDEKLSEKELTEWLKSKVARYQMPVKIKFLKELPLSSIGKIDTSVLNR